MVKEFKRLNPVDAEVISAIDNQKDRDFCKFQFTNNLECGSTIAYLKIGHILLGRDAFVYDEIELDANSSFFVPQYAIGVHTSEKGSLNTENEKVTVSNERVGKNTANRNNVYDRLYVHMVIRTKTGKLLTYHHNYELEKMKEFEDLITIMDNHKRVESKAVARKMVNNTTISMAFHPEYDNLNVSSDLRLIFNVVNPFGTSIELEPAILR